MFMKLKALVKGVVPYHITKIDPDQIRIANIIAIVQNVVSKCCIESICLAEVCALKSAFLVHYILMLKISIKINFACSCNWM